VRRSSSQVLRLGVFGDVGSFSEEAGLAWAEREGLTLGEDVELRHLVDPGGMMLALESGRVDRAVLPLHNTAAGIVLASVDALCGRSFRVVGQVALTIRQCLCVRSAGVDTAGVLAVVSHPHALAQCAATLDARFPGTERVAWSDTASAARDLGVGVLPAETTAVLTSTRAAERFDLHVLDPDAQDEDDNRTAFVVLERGA